MDDDDQRILELETKVEVLERKLDLAMRHLGLTYADGTMSRTEAEVGVLLAKGDKIEAIKVYRDATGADLKAAKEAVEALERKLGMV
jgi:ribosomal protein L7/L12